MARLNIKSTKAALINLLKKNEADHAGKVFDRGIPEAKEEALLSVAKELGITIKQEEYK